MKPFNLDELQVLVQRALDQSDMRKSLDFYEANEASQTSRDHLIGEAPSFIEVMEMVQKVAASPVATVLVLGESGTGKNLVARAIHRQSPRSENPFVTIECTTIPENLLESELFGHEKGAFTDASATKKGLFELANGGTIFVDEIGDMPLNMQPKLLRAIEEKRFKRVGGVVDFRVDVRVVAATNMDLEQAIEERAFRRDLYYRLNVVPVTLPPLRDRAGDAILLAEFYMAEFSRQFGKEFSSISDEAKNLLEAYPWPGNVRELRNVIERVVLLGSGTTIEAEHLILKSSAKGRSSSVDEMQRAGLTLDEMETELIRQALSAAGGNQTKAAKALGVSRDVLRYRMRKYSISN
jgi:transcriptional regulator with PAS, ATPase and Fis domain